MGKGAQMLTYILQSSIREDESDQIQQRSVAVYTTLPREEEEPLGPCYAAAEGCCLKLGCLETGRKEIAQAVF